VIRACLVVALCCAACAEAQAERLWLVIAASDPTPAGVARRAKTLARTVSGGLIVQTADCGDNKNVFAWVPDIAASMAAAQAALPRIRAVVKDSYIKPCDVKAGSLLALRVPVVDASIADVPANAVNWDDADRISSILALADGRFLIVARYFANVNNDPFEGRRERIVVAGAADQRRVLEDNCPSPGWPVVQQGRLAFHCAREQAGEHLLHTVLVFDAMGNSLMQIARCREPRWSASQTISCDEESVGPDGRLELKEKRVEIGQ
jgi:hypothetical protein